MNIFNLSKIDLMKKWIKYLLQFLDQITLAFSLKNNNNNNNNNIIKQTLMLYFVDDFILKTKYSLLLNYNLIKYLSNNNWINQIVFFFK